MQDIVTGIDWSHPVSEDLPAGPDTQYTLEFAELEAATTGTPEQQYGSIVIPAKTPEWQHVLELATRLSGQTRDLRVLLQMARALTRLHGLAGLKAGLDALDTLLKHRWEHVHPQIVVDGVEDPQVRFGVLSEFAATGGLVNDVRQATFFNTPLGILTVRDLERVAEQGSVELNGASIARDQIDEMARNLDRQEAASLALPGHLVQLLGAVRQDIETRAGPEFTPDLTSLAKPLERVASLFQGVMQAGHPAESGDGFSMPAPASSEPLGIPTSRTAVVKAMDAICTYLERNEPTNPAQLLVRRARRFMDMGFLDIVKEMSPDGLNQALFIAGTDGKK